MTNWEQEIILPEKNPEIEYAYILQSGGELRTCTKDELYENITWNKKVVFVTTPNHPTFILPGTDFETLVPILERRKASHISSLKIYGLMAFLLILLKIGYAFNSDKALFSERGDKFFLLAFIIYPILNAVYELYNIRKMNETNYHDEAFEIKFQFWLSQKRVLSLLIFTIILAMITLFQFYFGIQKSVELVGLVKPKVFDGEYWRLLTATLVHGGVLHIVFNAFAIYSVGLIVIRLAGFYRFAIIFLLSGILGSIFSVLFLPTITSVGASGGIMGLIGFLLILGLKLKQNVPRNFIKTIFIVVVMNVILGLTNLDLIDNAAHGGGFLGGCILGLLMINKNKLTIPYPRNKWTSFFGILSTIIVVIGLISVIVLLVRG